MMFINHLINLKEPSNSTITRLFSAFLSLVCFSKVSHPVLLGRVCLKKYITTHKCDGVLFLSIGFLKRAGGGCGETRENPPEKQLET